MKRSILILFSALFWISCSDDDKAIDVVDEAASHIRIQSDSKPAQLEATDRQIMQLKIEQAALLREAENPANKKRLEALKKQLETLGDESRELTQKWEAVKRQMAEIAALPLSQSYHVAF